MAKIHTHYDNLKVAPNAPNSVIKAAYKALVQECHPDKFEGSKQEAERITKLIINSYQVLIDPVKRAEHDSWINERHKNTKLEKLATYKIGEILSDGSIVFYVHASRSHGLAVKRADEGSSTWSEAFQLVKSTGECWRLPTNNELTLLFEQKSVVGGFADGWLAIGNGYWSSSEYDSNDANCMSFIGGKRSVTPVRVVH